MTSCIPQLSFSFYRHRSIRADFSGGQITSDAGLLPLRAFDQRHGLARELAECVCDDRDDSRVSHPGLSLLRQACTRSSLATKMPTTPTGYVTIRHFKFLPINRSANLSDHSQLSAAGRTHPRLATSSSCKMLCSIGL